MSIKAERKLYNVKPELFNLGRTTLTTPAGNKVPVYNLLRTICDIIRSRNKVGTETFLAALRLYAASPKKDLNKLHSYAKKMRVANVLRRGVFNTRPRNFYDTYILTTTQKFDKSVFADALIATAAHRSTAR